MQDLLTLMQRMRFHVRGVGQSNFGGRGADMAGYNLFVLIRHYTDQTNMF